VRVSLAPARPQNVVVATHLSHGVARANAGKGVEHRRRLAWHGVLGDSHEELADLQRHRGTAAPTDIAAQSGMTGVVGAGTAAGLAGG